ncbi:MAG: UMP kinase, partial [Nanoarchaeota archaeon]|nr:UMP kinase [Nanoarchaeota archaeon]
MKDKTVISLGGSLIVPNEIDVGYLKSFSHLIRTYATNQQFYLIAGGGKTARTYIQGAKGVREEITPKDEDWLGIHATRLNAHLIRTIFQDIARPEIVTFPGRRIDGDFPVIVGAGYRPGNSTDYIAVKMAQVNGVKKVINLSNIPYAYDKDPKQHTDAKKLIDINWKEFRKIVGDKWIPGMNTPFDPIASILAEQHNMTVIIADGKNLTNL